MPLHLCLPQQAFEHTGYMIPGPFARRSAQHSTILVAHVEDGRWVEVDALGSVDRRACGSFVALIGKVIFMYESHTKILSLNAPALPLHLPKHLFAGRIRRHSHLKLRVLVGCLASQPILIIPTGPDRCGILHATIAASPELVY
jgi:hypothetical protein